MWNDNTRQQGSRCWHHHLFASLHEAAFCEPTCLFSHRGNGKQCWSYTLVCVCVPPARSTIQTVVKGKAETKQNG